MEFKKFVEKAVKQNMRNIFEENAGKVAIAPEELLIFYKMYNPVHVEITMNGYVVRLYPADKLADLQTDYAHLGEERFVFATCNSDPIYLYKGKIYTTYHGSPLIDDELMADSFNEFLDLID